MSLTDSISGGVRGVKAPGPPRLACWRDAFRSGTALAGASASPSPRIASCQDATGPCGRSARSQQASLSMCSASPGGSGDDWLPLRKKGLDAREQGQTGMCAPAGATAASCGCSGHSCETPTLSRHLVCTEYGRHYRAPAAAGTAGDLASQKRQSPEQCALRASPHLR